MAEGAARWPSRDVSFCEARGVCERSRIPEKRSGRRNSQNLKKKKEKEKVRERCGRQFGNEFFKSFYYLFKRNKLYDILCYIKYTNIEKRV